MIKFISLLTICMFIFGCGPHRITYINPPLEKQTILNKTTLKSTTHSHGIGPLIIGGGIGFFWVMNEISPAFIDYTGDVNTKDVCPEGFSSVSHYQPFGQNALSGLLSWIVLLNVYQGSRVEWNCFDKPQLSNTPEQLRGLKKLFDDGVLTKEEYEIKKTKYVNQL